MDIETGDSPLLGEKTLHLSREERAALVAEHAARQAASLTCPTCGLRNPVGQLVCIRCQSDLVAREITLNLGLDPALPEARTRAVGDVLIAANTPIIFEIDSIVLQLPVAARLTLGRQAVARDAKISHIDLTPYAAWESGISRTHVEIRRKIMLAYIVDLGSTNGSVLNGRRLYPHAEHLLRSGDKLQFSRMNITVKF
jgi:hypothetical protein